MKCRKIWCSKMICMGSMLVVLVAFLCGCDATSRRLELSSKPGTEASEGTFQTDHEGLEKDRATSLSEITVEREVTGRSEASDVSGLTGETATTCYVHVCGQVKHPGLYELPAGRRIGDAIDMAGGLLKEADSVAVNLAAVLEDGMQIYVPSMKEREAGNKASASAGTNGQTDAFWSGKGSAGAASAGTSGTAGGISEASGKVNINTASIEELTTLSGIGESKARAIIQYREEHGTFSSAEEITSVSGIGDGTYKKIKDSITVQ